MPRVTRTIGHNGTATDPGAARPDDLPIVAEVLNSDEFRCAIDQLAIQLGRDNAAVQAEAANYLREMGATHSPAVVRAWHRLSAWLVRGYEIVTKDAELAELRRLDDQHTLIFLISHRSYLDEFALPPRLVSAGIAPCVGMAGANLEIVHVRRASEDMPVYRMALRALVGRMVTTGHNWSGRSRVAVLAPKNCVRPDTGCCATSPTPLLAGIHGRAYGRHTRGAHRPGQRRPP
jgi:glycerol-3-phosphate O-acyltransferase